MFDKTKGMIWYRIFQIILCIWFLSGFFTILCGPLVAVTVPEIHQIYPEYITLCRCFGVLQCIVCFFLLKAMIQYQYSMLKWLKFSIILFPVCIITDYLFLSFYYGIALLPSDIARLIGGLIGVSICLIPTYFYLKNHWIEQSYKKAQDLPPIFDPVAMISIRLEGCADQNERDKIVREIMTGQRNPYTGLIIATEADWNAYLAMKRARHKELPDFSSSAQIVECKPETIISTSTEVPPNEATSKSFESDIRFCRFCGNTLHDDSVFCDKCGRKIR